MIKRFGFAPGFFISLGCWENESPCHRRGGGRARDRLGTGPKPVGETPSLEPGKRGGRLRKKSGASSRQGRGHQRPRRSRRKTPGGPDGCRPRKTAGARGQRRIPTARPENFRPDETGGATGGQQG